MSTVFRGQPDVECFNAMGVDAMTVGNHEFDFGLQNFLDLKHKARFPFLSSNIIEKDTGKLLCTPYVSLELADRISVSIIGVTTKALLTTTGSDLDAERERIRYEETNLGNFVADLVREASGARIALINGGSLRASIDEGPITLEDVYKTMPYANEIVVIELTGAEIKQVLTWSVMESREDEDGGFLHVSGIRFQVRGKTVEAVAVGDLKAPLEPGHTYRVAISDFLASGGDGYEIFSGKQADYTCLPLRELIADTIRSRKVIESRVDGRIVRVND